MVTLLGPVPCHDCHAHLYLKRYRGRVRWLEANERRPWRVHICTAKPILSPQELNILSHRHARWRAKMSMLKLGGSMNYRDMGPGAPRGAPNYTVGGRSVHANDASSGLSKGTVRDTRPHAKQPGAYKAQAFVIKRQRNLARVVQQIDQ